MLFYRKFVLQGLVMREFRFTGFRYTTLYQDFVIWGFVRQEMGNTGLVIPGISCYVKGLVAPGFCYTCMSLYIRVRYT